jgi:SPP1 gp7 family putative phage head morphogenesis protein
MRLQLDPDDDEAEQLIARAIETQAADDIERALRHWLREVFPNGSEAEIANWERRLLAGEAKVRDVLARALQNGVDLGVNMALDQMGQVGIGFDYTLVNTAARQWAADYVGLLITQITDTTRNAVRQQVATWVTNGDPLSTLIRDLTPAFGRRRAEMIAATEVTRAFAEAERIAVDSTPAVSGYEWQTARDDRVCPVCGPLHGQRIAKGETFGGLFPPAHVGCRCWVIGWVA